jgi:hypothetical protein
MAASAAKPRRRLKDEAALRAARRDYRRYGAWLRRRDVPGLTRSLRLSGASWWKGEWRERAFAIVRRKYGTELTVDDATLERYLRGK